MTLQQLKYALMVAKFHSINEAAQALCVTQPTISVSLKDLEAELGIVIFNRSSRGIDITTQGREFLGYARNIVEQTEVLRDRYVCDQSSVVHFIVSSQHYSFSVSAFINLVSKYGMEKYDFCLRETRTQDVIDDVGNLTSDIGIIYISEFNRAVISRRLRERALEFTPLGECMAHVFISRNHALANREVLSLADLADSPFLCFEQGSYSSDFFSEEVISNPEGVKTIRVSDRATLFNLLRGLNGYTICSGVIDVELDPDIVAVPLASGRKMTIGYITKKCVNRTTLCAEYIELVRQALGQAAISTDADVEEDKHSLCA